MKWFRFNIWKPKPSLLPAVKEPEYAYPEYVPTPEQVTELGKRVSKKLLDAWLPLETWRPNKGEDFGKVYSVIEWDDEMDSTTYMFFYKNEPFFTMFRGSWDRFNLAPAGNWSKDIPPHKIGIVLFNVLTLCEKHFDDLAKKKQDAIKASEDKIKNHINHDSHN